jgi:hypothetical protein
MFTLNSSSRRNIASYNSPLKIKTMKKVMLLVAAVAVSGSMFAQTAMPVKETKKEERKEMKKAEEKKDERKEMKAENKKAEAKKVPAAKAKKAEAPKN